VKRKLSKQQKLFKAMNVKWSKQSGLEAGDSENHGWPSMFSGAKKNEAKVKT
jgi:hypothetical protein